ncbi:kinesin-like DNA-binding protein [Encephalitozoon romaleae SJ-2008]|uniref:Kinesin-like DNA-binding protein n=1 Tax=Encephalitozoon romaleae (strain SJ-2008) TaxID=1178016 RepID=I7AUM6_ENCRO|nr:kinesin-like DNA-binding protein [Encephalitozoon romaleae SJ-2008]AFN84172.1 kinesin-like DNA-binding protein [Encephalitozoon romaleae SJ-2008]
MKGHNQTLFCYGSTGAGKTYTMVGHSGSYGLMHNLVKDVLAYGSFLVSYMEIYNEKIYDLLEPKELVLRECNGTIVIPNLFNKRVENIEEFEEVFRQGTKNRTTAETKLNKNSSRSHGILRISVGEHKLNLIDLAGSENNRKTGNEGIRLTESNSINRSLFVLGKVVNAILKGEKRIPYRDSKLTRLLQDSLGGSSLCYIIANIVGDSSGMGDSINTLSFASKSRNIVNILDVAQKPRGKDFKNGGCSLSELGKRKPLSIKTNMKFNIQRKEDMPLRSKEKENNPHQESFPTSTSAIGGKKKGKSSLIYRRCKEDGGKFSKNPKLTSNGSSLILKSLLEKPDIVLSPRTKEKSYRAFLKRAQEFESAKKYRLALEDYKTMQKFCDNDFIKQKIEKINMLIKKTRRKPKVTKENVLQIINQGNFFDIKKLPRVGDKRAQAIVDFVNGGNFFETLNDLKLLFSEKIVDSILFSIDDG